mgnify:CR=1 FL=1
MRAQRREQADNGAPGYKGLGIIGQRGRDRLRGGAEIEVCKYYAGGVGMKQEAFGEIKKV